MTDYIRDCDCQGCSNVVDVDCSMFEPGSGSIQQSTEVTIERQYRVSVCVNGK